VKLRQKSGQYKPPAETVVKEIGRRTRKQHSAEEKIRIVLEGLRGEDSIAELCLREGIATLSAETGLHRNALRGQLAASGLSRFAPVGKSFVPIYPRAPTVSALRRKEVAAANHRSENVIQRGLRQLCLSSGEKT
jgi:transposase-like protein